MYTNKPSQEVRMSDISSADSHGHTAPFHKHKPLVFVLALIAALAGLLFGLDIGVISGALPFIGKELQADTLVQEKIVSSLLWGATLGAILSGWCSKRYGRKMTLLAAAVIFAIGSLLSASATTSGILMGIRFFLGLAVGIASFTAPLYLSEIAPSSVRGALISMYQLMITIGILVAFISDTYFASYASFHGIVGGHWRIMLGVLTIPATIMFVGILFLPESPRWLTLKNLQEAALDVLRSVRVSEEEAKTELHEIVESLKVKQAGISLFLQSAPFRRTILLGILLQVIQQLTGINVVMYYMPKIMEYAGFETVLEQMWGTVAVGTVNVLATFIAIAFVDKVGRKPIMYAGFVTMGLSMCMVGFLFGMGFKENQALAFAAIAFLYLFIVGFAFSAGPIIWVLCAEIQPLKGRDLGITVSTATNWIVNGVVGMTFLTMLEKLGPSPTFWIYGLVEALFILYFLLYVPETKGVSLEKIEEHLFAGKKLRNIGR